MRLLKSLWLATAAAVTAWCSTVAATDNGKQTDVVWDKYSLTVNDKRLFVFSGEFHYHRLPVPELWLDVFQKLRANGFNTISVYFFWNWHSPSKDVFDFETGAHDVQRVFDYAKEAGLHVIARSGPYCNGERTAGGHPLWAIDGQLGEERTNDEMYHEAWAPWIKAIGEIIAANQITEGGPVILNQHENELRETNHEPDDPLVLYMEQLKAAFEDVGVVVPSSHNEKGLHEVSWSTDYQNVGGAVNIYGMDTYPGGFDCEDPDVGFELSRDYYQWFQNYSFTQPEYMSEFEGGWFTPWGGSFYDNCSSELSPEFADVYYKNNVGSRVTLQNIYMSFGGTNWGHGAAPVVYSSYDYGAPLRETREIRDKLKQTKLLGLFTRVSTDLLKTDMEGNGTSYTSDESIFSWVLRNPDTKAGFYVLAHDNSRSRNVTNFAVNVNTTKGPVSIPDVQLDGRQSKIIVTDYSIGNTTLLYSSAEVLTYANLDVDVVVFYLNVGQVGTFEFVDPSQTTFRVYGDSKLSTSQTETGISYTYTQAEGVTAVKFSNGLLAYLVDKESAWDFFAPPTTSNPQVKPNEHIFVHGPYLVRDVFLSEDEVHLRGDNAETTSIEVYAGDVKKITWNGTPLKVKRTPYGSSVGQIPGTEDVKASLPALTRWKSEDTLPEVDPLYDDSNWTVCNSTSTLNPVEPLTLPILYSSHYGFHPGTKIYRGRFDGNDVASSNITVQNGVAAGWAAWLNGKYVGGALGDPEVEVTWAELDFGNVTLQAENNVLTIITDYTGHDQNNVGPAGTQNPRGILGATLSGDNDFTSWRLQGNAGGESNIDPVRGHINEGGLFGERMGWHLPGYRPGRHAMKDSPLDGVDAAEGRFYTTTFDLNIDKGLDVPLGLKLGAPEGTKAVVQIFINGYQYGHYLPHFGPQNVFPFQPGIINNSGKNTLAISMWALTEEGARLDTVELVSYGKYRTSFDFHQDWSHLQPGWEDRSQYA